MSGSASLFQNTSAFTQSERAYLNSWIYTVPNYDPGNRPQFPSFRSLPLAVIGGDSSSGGLSIAIVKLNAAVDLRDPLIADRPYRFRIRSSLPVTRSLKREYASSTSGNSA